MRSVLTSVLAVLVSVGLSLATAPAAFAASNKQHPSSNLPWAIGLAVIVLLALLALMMFLRRGVSRRREAGPFRDPDA
jgi:ABC-type Na+ efflux pump permease subunit